MDYRSAAAAGTARVSRMVSQQTVRYCLADKQMMSIIDPLDSLYDSSLPIFGLSNGLFIVIVQHH